jgi:hypothetical protein
MPISNKLFEVSKLDSDGGNYLTWKLRLELVLDARGLSKYISEFPPSEPSASADAATRTTHKTTMTTWNAGNQSARLQIIQTINDDVLMSVIEKTLAKDLWEALSERFDGAGAQSAALLMGRVWRSTMSEEKDLLTQINEIKGNTRKLTAIGYPVSDNLLTIAIILSLPSSYSTLQTILMTSPDALDLHKMIATILSTEMLHREGGETALKALTSKGSKSRSYGKGKKSDVKCTNPKCGKTGHTFQQCWAEGGGSEGKH